MGKVSLEDKLRIQTLRKRGLAYRKIMAKYPNKNWNMNTVKNICKRVDKNESVVARKHGSGRPKTARTVENIEKVSSKMADNLSKTYDVTSYFRAAENRINVFILGHVRVAIVKCYSQNWQPKLL